jgi:hypothetical protein
MRQTDPRVTKWYQRTPETAPIVFSDEELKIHVKRVRVVDMMSVCRKIKDGEVYFWRKVGHD